MKRFRLFLFFSPLLFLFSCSSPQAEDHTTKNDSAQHKKAAAKNKPRQKKGLRYPKLLTRGVKTPYDDAKGRSGDTIFLSSYKGKIAWTDTTGKEQHPLFDLKCEFMVDKVYIINLYDDAYFLNWQETDHEGVKTYAAVYEYGKDKPEWKFGYKAPNPGQPVIDSGDVYISTLGMIAKLSLADGHAYWKYDSLYNTFNFAYQQFKPARVYEDRIIFIDYPIPGRREKSDSLVINAATGKRMR